MDADVHALHCGLAIAAPEPQEEEAASQPVLGELRAPHVTSESVQLEWSVPEGTFDSFTLQYRDAQGQPQVLPVDGGSRTLTVPGLSPSRRYKFNLYGLWGRTRLGPVSTDTVTGEGALAPAPLNRALEWTEAWAGPVLVPWSVEERWWEGIWDQWKGGGVVGWKDGGLLEC